MEFCFDCKIELGDSHHPVLLPRRCRKCGNKTNELKDKRRIRMIGNKISTGLFGNKNSNWRGGSRSTAEGRMIYAKKYHKKNYHHLKEWRKRNPDKIKIYNQRMHAIRRSIGSLCKKTVQEVYEENIKFYGTLTCIYCLKPIEFGKDTLEHKHPVSLGGKNDKNNLAIACSFCNTSKKNKTYEEYMERINQQPQGA